MTTLSQAFSCDAEASRSSLADLKGETMPQEAATVSFGRIVLRPSTIIRVLGALAIFLIVASIAGQLMKYFGGHPRVYGLVRLFYVEEERNIPTFFAGLLLMFAALLLAVVTILGKKQRDPDVLKWMILTFGFIYMTFDELMSYHEKLIMPMRRLLPDATGGIFFFSWVIPAIVVVIFLGSFFVGFLRRLPERTRLLFLLAATLYLGGAIGFELMEGRYRASNGDVEDFNFSMLATGEEGLEMTGVIVFIYALLRFIALKYKEVQFRID
jgi:hypothetical protein